MLGTVARLLVLAEGVLGSSKVPIDATGTDRAASAPIGIILMVGLTVIVAGVLATTVLGIDVATIADRAGEILTGDGDADYSFV